MEKEQHGKGAAWEKNSMGKELHGKSAAWKRSSMEKEQHGKIAAIAYTNSKGSGEHAHLCSRPC